MKIIIDIPEKTNAHIRSDYGHGVKCLRDEDRVILCDAIYHGKHYEERPNGDWIPCSERLPEKSGQYYVSGGGKVWVCNFLIIPDSKGGWCNDVSNPVVKAWMPFPKPYEEEGDEE